MFSKNKTIGFQQEFKGKQQASQVNSINEKKVFILQINYNKTKTTAKQKIVSIEKSGLPFFSALIYDGFSHYKYSPLKNTTYLKEEKTTILQIGYSKTTTITKQEIVQKSSGLPFFSTLIYDDLNKTLKNTT